MRTLNLPSRLSPKALILALAVVGAVPFALALRAQVDGERGIPPIAASTDIEVGGVEVNVSGDTPEEARQEGWQEAARLAWKKIGGPELSDSQLQSLVSAIVIEREQVGPRRYVARLGVVFDRTRATRYLGNQSEAQRSAPLLMVPVTMSAGTQLVYERRNPWQRAWAEFQPGASRINYVRPAGSGGESLLVTYGQTTRRSRTWWRNVLDQFGAADVIVPIADLRYTYPGGPVEGTFTARYGPDSIYLDSFEMTAANSEELPAMLGQAVQRLDRIFQNALAAGRLQPDPTLISGNVTLDRQIQILVDRARAVLAQAQAESRSQGLSDRELELRQGEPGQAVTDAPVRTPPPEGSVALYSVQFATPDPASFDAVLAAVRGAEGVRSAGVRSTAIGGTSAMTVGFAGSIAELADALRGRGLTVQQSGSALTVSR
ncbi:heavy-metal-associated domain-containing protein [Qipengyuania spongiae]|uniref:Heavy-metal-associated domain-containing protein n=1 Tax=Qipengyuania spongiae TaxID=2909673 RepID=A0ABY5SU85_9SPHN|nr:heavy-metal-associated domain-containing protein [Qipengyuania spongiae]UVI38062.1 heavy-metal-associated domain-containing protein [Qipengyuania spongiae]